MKDWKRLSDQWQKDLKLWLYCMLALSVFRAAFLVVFRDRIEASSTYRDIVAALLNGMRYDSVAASYFLIVPFTLSLICGFVDIDRTADRARKFVGTAFVFSSTLLWFVTFGYFKEFGDHFNHFLFGLVYDDRKATLITIWKEYHVLPNLLGICLVVFLMHRILRRIIRKPLGSSRLPTACAPGAAHRILLSLLILSLFAIGLRGSAGRRPVQLKDAGITQDEFLNKATLNPYLALLYAVERHHRLVQSGGIQLFLPDRDVIKAAQYVFSTQAVHQNLDEYLQRYARGPKAAVPSHLFIIIGESYSTWPMLPEYASLGLAEGVKKLAERGLYIETFLPSSGGTMASLSAVVAGLPFAGVFPNYQQTSQSAYPTSLAHIFKQLGYATRFFYGGYLSWQMVGDFCRHQGFDEVYGGAHMGRWVSSNEWGVDDEVLFDFVLEKVTEEPPSVNVILTTTCHPPFDIDVRAKGFTLKEIPADLKEAFTDEIDLNLLGHFWYADRAIADFTRKSEGKLKLALFAITGDHAWRRDFLKRPDLFEKTAVPLVLYGRDVLSGLALPREAAGSHIDMGPTLVELCAPQGFLYHSMGKDLLDPSQRPLGISRDRIVGPNFIADLQGSPRIYPLRGFKSPTDQPDMVQLKRLHDAIHGIGWWRIMKGPEL